MIESIKLTKAEYAIEDLAKSLDVTEKEIVEILKDGIEMQCHHEGNSKILEETKKLKYKYFIDEMEATFDCY